MEKNLDIELEKSSGNVFADLGLPNPEERLIKAELAFQINALILKKGLSQREAATLLKIDQPKISALNCGRLEAFSIERLFKFLGRLNQDIEIVIKPQNETSSINFKHIHVKYA